MNLEYRHTPVFTIFPLLGQNAQHLVFKGKRFILAHSFSPWLTGLKAETGRQNSMVQEVEKEERAEEGNTPQ